MRRVAAPRRPTSAWRASASGSQHVVREILPGLHHWTAQHPDIGVRVSSYLVAPAAIVVDPLLGDETPGSLAAVVRPQQVVLTSGLHIRDAGRVAEHFGIPIRCSQAGAERIGDRLEVREYTDGEELAPGVTALEVGVLCPDEFALHVDLGAHRALVVADAVLHYGGALVFAPDELLGADPAAVKDGLRNRLRALLQRDFDTLLPAHGDPIVGGADSALREFAGDR